MNLPYSNSGQRDALLGEVRAEMSRQRPRVTQQMLADATDSHITTVSRWLSGETDIRLTDLIRVCDHLGVTLADLARRAAANTAGAA